MRVLVPLLGDTHVWLTKGPRPRYENLLHLEEVNSQSGPWILLDGFIQQRDRDDGRQVFTFLRSLLVKPNQVTKIFTTFDALEYPGNMAIPEPLRDYYTYAGEIPWSSRFGSALRNSNGRAKRNTAKAFSIHNGKRWLPGIPVEVPVHEFIWESYHSPLNQVSNISFPAPALCERLHLSNRQGESDLYDRAGRLSTVYRNFKADNDTLSSRLLFLRADLMANYLEKTGQNLIWLVWGERGFDYRTLTMLKKKFKDLFSGYGHIHRYRTCWKP